MLKFLLHKSEAREKFKEFHQDGELAEDDKLMIPIHYAVLKNDYSMVSWLIQNKAEETALKAIIEPQVPLSSQKPKRNLSATKGQNLSVEDIRDPKERRKLSARGSRSKENLTPEQ